jgi:quinol monooxygenase YgiN
MVIVIGTIVGTDETIDELVELSLEHVRRSRTEPGCLSHAVYRDVENDLRLEFVERWADRAALDAHFAVPASGAMVERAAELAAEPPAMKIYEVADRPR